MSRYRLRGARVFEVPESFGEPTGSPSGVGCELCPSFPLLEARDWRSLPLYARRQALHQAIQYLLENNHIYERRLASASHAAWESFVRRIREFESPTPIIRIIGPISSEDQEEAIYTMTETPEITGAFMRVAQERFTPVDEYSLDYTDEELEAYR